MLALVSPLRSTVYPWTLLKIFHSCPGCQLDNINIEHHWRSHWKSTSVQKFFKSKDCSKFWRKENLGWYFDLVVWSQHAVLIVKLSDLMYSIVTRVTLMRNQGVSRLVTKIIFGLKSASSSFRLLTPTRGCGATPAPAPQHGYVIQMRPPVIYNTLCNSLKNTVSRFSKGFLDLLISTG